MLLSVFVIYITVSYECQKVAMLQIMLEPAPQYPP